jgi:citrate lyase beta subunit
MAATRLERSVLSVPAIREDMIAKAAVSPADAVCLDLEDSVTVDDKRRARANAIAAFRERSFGRRIRMLRINALNTPFAYRDLVDVVEAAGDRIDLIMLPRGPRRGEPQQKNG